MSDQLPSITNKVGPVGSFSLEYELVKAVPSNIEELIEQETCAALRSQSVGGRARIRGPR